MHYSKEYTIGKSTDGLEEEEKEKEVIQPRKQFEKTELEGKMEIEPTPLQEEKPAEDFVAVPKTTSFRASLRKRNAMLSSDESDSDENRRSSEDELPTYTADYEDEIATTGYATIPNQFKPSHPRKSALPPSTSFPPASSITNPTPLWEAEDISASESDEEEKWEQTLIQRATAGPRVQPSAMENLAASRCEWMNEWIDPVPSEYSIVSQERVMHRLNSALNDLRVGVDQVGVVMTDDWWLMTDGNV